MTSKKKHPIISTDFPPLDLLPFGAPQEFGVVSKPIIPLGSSARFSHLLAFYQGSSGVVLKGDELKADPTA